MMLASTPTRRLLVFVSLLSALALLTGCPPADRDSGALGDAEYRAAVPRNESMTIAVPDDSGTGQLALGERSELYEFTRGVSASVNGHVATMLLWLRLVTLLPPTERGDDYRVWGPSEPEGLEAVSWRLTVRKLAEDRFELTLDGRPKGSTDEAAFLPVIAGEVTPRGDDLHTAGSLTLLFDNSKALGSDPCRSGTIQVDWDATRDEARTVDVAWSEFVNSCEEEEFLDVTYHFDQTAEASGEFEFVVVDDIHDGDATKPGTETLEIKSRWLGDGRGRSDFYIKGPEIEADLAAAGLTATEVQASQCWDSLFALTFSDSAPDELESVIMERLGNEADCPFVEADYPAL